MDRDPVPDGNGPRVGSCGVAVAIGVADTPGVPDALATDDELDSTDGWGDWESPGVAVAVVQATRLAPTNRTRAKRPNNHCLALGSSLEYMRSPGDDAPPAERG